MVNKSIVNVVDFCAVVGIVTSVKANFISLDEPKLKSVVTSIVAFWLPSWMTSESCDILAPCPYSPLQGLALVHAVEKLVGIVTTILSISVAVTSDLTTILNSIRP